jgi:hypothetical protein
MTGLNQGADGRASNRACGAQHEHTARMGGGARC